jgi:hypothetical protein
VGDYRVNCSCVAKMGHVHCNWSDIYGIYGFRKHIKGEASVIEQLSIITSPYTCNTTLKVRRRPNGSDIVKMVVAGMKMVVVGDGFLVVVVSNGGCHLWRWFGIKIFLGN